MSKYDFIIGIDPDVDKSGVCGLSVATKEVTVTCLSFSELFEHLSAVKVLLDGQDVPMSYCVVIEASWKHTHNWHTKRGESPAIAAKKGYAVGRNHEVGHKIVEMCEVLGIECIEHAPLVKCWKGRDRKITQQEIEQFVPGFPKRSNPEMRDATLLAWSYAGLPIRIKGGMK